MEASTLLIGGIAAAGAGVLGLAIGRMSSRTTIGSLEDDVRRVSGALEERVRVSAEDRQVQGLILGSMQEGVLLFDGGWRTAFANDALGRHLGPPPAALVQLYPPGLREMAQRVAKTNELETTEIETGSPTRWLRVTATPAGDDGSVLLVVTDITETRRIEAVRRDFVANASHELKTPTASIRAAAETLLHAAREDPAAVPHFAEQLDHEAIRLSRIVADLLDLSRLESGSDLAERVRLDAIVREEGQRFEEPASEAGLALRVDAPNTPPVRGSARDLSLLVRNLIDNAIRYARTGGNVEVAMRSENGSVILRVADDGLGIPSRDLPRIFERFYRVDRARSRETGGTGLGLAIVRHVAENHGGTVTVSSELGRGSSFEVVLPAAPND